MSLKETFRKDMLVAHVEIIEVKVGIVFYPFRS
jgi:hypothetical protein